MNRIISHPEYDYTSFEHDIALVRLTEPLEYGELVSTSYSHNKVFFFCNSFNRWARCP